MPKLLINPNFKIIGHRGVKSLRPENTMVSFRYANQIGLNWIEFDTRPTKCNNWVVIHDDTVDRTTNGKGYVIDKTLEELQNLDAGSWFDPQYKNERIPRLDEVINFAFDKEMFLNIEVKLETKNPQQIDFYANSFNDFIKNHYPDVYSKPLISSFNTKFLIRLRELNDNLPIGLLTEKISNQDIDLVKQYNFTTINCGIKNFNESDFELAFKNFIPVLIFTVNDKKIYDKLVKLGIHAVFTDSPHLLNQTIATQMGLKENQS